jgi:hypothetical protein
MPETVSSAAAAAATVQTLVAFCFDGAQARAAVDAIGDKADAQLAISWLLDHGEEDKGGAVVFRHCLHLDGLRAPDSLVSIEELSLGGPCAICASAKENWICLFCGLHLCSRYVAKHSLSHWQETREGPSLPHGHHLMLSEGDLSVWCHVCEAYIDNEQVQPLVERMRAAKFGGGAAAASSSSLTGAASPGESTAVAGATESERARGKRKAAAGVEARPETGGAERTNASAGKDATREELGKTREHTPGDGAGKAPPAWGGSSPPPSPPAAVSLPCSADAALDVEQLSRQWEQSMLLADRLSTGTGGQDETDEAAGSEREGEDGDSRSRDDLSAEGARQPEACLGEREKRVSARVDGPAVSADGTGATSQVPMRDLEVKGQVSADSLDKPG